MRIEIEIPKEFEEHFKQDKFADSLERILADIEHSLSNRDCLCAGRYELETIEMLEKAFQKSKPAYDVDKSDKDDLISRNKLILSLNDYALQESPSDNESAGERRVSKMIYDTIQNCITCVEEQPTACDMGKTVEELKEEPEVERC